jgi:uncharacterized protein YdeI (YjbR/CyaY-like superfamily)
MSLHRGLPVLDLPDRDDWRSWLEVNHASSQGLWLRLAKKNASVTSVSHAEALDEAICYGWIDGQRLAHDEHSFLQRFTPRRPRSKWSQINRSKALALIDEGRMTAAGLAEVRAAQQDGRWERAYEPQSRATVPPDFQRELERHPAAKEFFETLRGARRYAFLYRLHETTRPETRAKRIASYLELLNEGKTLLD